MLLTNKRSERWRAKYQLEHVVRVHLGADDTAYRYTCTLLLPLFFSLRAAPGKLYCRLDAAHMCILGSHFWPCTCSVQMPAPTEICSAILTGATKCPGCTKFCCPVLPWAGASTSIRMRRGTWG